MLLFKLIVSHWFVYEAERKPLVNLVVQSNFTRVIQPKITIAGLKKDFKPIIFLATLIYMGTMNDASGKRIMAGNSHEFEELEGRITELERDLGVISRFDDGNLISKFGTATFVKFKCWYSSCICKYI
jgi:hypothetical protein